MGNNAFVMGCIALRIEDFSFQMQFVLLQSASFTHMLHLHSSLQLWIRWFTSSDAQTSL